LVNEPNAHTTSHNTTGSVRQRRASLWLRNVLEKRALFVSGRFNRSGHEGECGCAIDARDAVRASVGPVIHIAGNQFARFVRVGPFNDEYDLVTNMAMPRQLRTRLEPRQHSPPMRLLVVQDRFLPDTGERYLSTPLFADVPADMTEEEIAISKSTPSAQMP